MEHYKKFDGVEELGAGLVEGAAELLFIGPVSNQNGKRDDGDGCGCLTLIAVMALLGLILMLT